MVADVADVDDDDDDPVGTALNASAVCDGGGGVETWKGVGSLRTCSKLIRAGIVVLRRYPTSYRQIPYRPVH